MTINVCNHQPNLQLRIRDLADKAVSVAAGLAHCGLANQESQVKQLGYIASECTRIRDECFVCTHPNYTIP